MKQGGLGSWASLDENVRACVLLHLRPNELAQVAQTSRGLAKETENEMVWATLFLRRFGSDFWGERAPSHPYHTVPQEVNEWRQQPATSVYASFLEGADKESAVSLLDFVRANAKDEVSGWKVAYRRYELSASSAERMHEMVSLWQMMAKAACIIAGHTSFERLSSIADIIKEIVSTDNIPARLCTDEPSHPSFAPIDISSPTGDCRVFRADVRDLFSLRVEYAWEGHRAVTNYCVVRRPRNWWMGSERHFRGLTLEDSPWPTRLGIVYAIDCEHMDDPEYQEQVFRELHGMLGEGKGQFHQGLCLNLHLINPPSVDDVDPILKRLKIPLLRQPRYNCEYYAGPVVFYVTAFNMSPDETPEARRRREELVSQAYFWLMNQPSYYPHWNAPDPGNGWLCALTDERAKREQGWD